MKFLEFVINVLLHTFDIFSRRLFMDFEKIDNNILSYHILNILPAFWFFSFIGFIIINLFHDGGKYETLALKSILKNKCRFGIFLFIRNLFFNFIHTLFIFFKFSSYLFDRSLLVFFINFLFIKDIFHFFHIFLLFD